MSNSEVKENFIVLRVKGPKFIMKKPIVRRANKKETWQNFLQNSCGLKQVSKKAGFFVKTVLPETRRRRSDGEHYGWTAEMDEKIGTFIGRFWQRRNKNTVILYCRLPVRSEGGREELMALSWSPMPASSSSAPGEEPEEIGDDDDYVRRVTLEKMEICSSDSEDSEPETDDNSEEPVNPKTEPESDFETEYEENEEMSFGSSDLFAEGQDDDDDGGNATGQEDNILILFDSSDPPEEVPAKNNENREEGNGNGQSGDDVNRGASTSASAQEDDEKPSTSSQCPMPASSTKDVAKKELERCSNGYLSKIKQELEDLKARNMWEGIEEKSPLASRLLEDLFKV